MKSFKITTTEANTTWVNENLTAQDFKIEGKEIVIFYFNEMQKNDILNAIESLVEKTYDVVFNDETNSNNKGFAISLEASKNYIESNNGTNESYFSDYKGGTVSIVCNQTEETIFETEIL